MLVKRLEQDTERPATLQALEEADAAGYRWIQLASSDGALRLVFWDPKTGKVIERVVQPGPYARPSQHGWPLAWGFEQQLDDGLDWIEPAVWSPLRGDGVHRVPLGPVRSDAGEAIRYELAGVGDEIHRTRITAHFKRRSSERLMTNQSVDAALAVAERITGTSPVAHGLALTQAAASCVADPVDPAKARIRTTLAELERVMSHLGDLAYLAQSTGTVTAAADLYRLKESVLRFNAAWVGHRYLRGALRPDGVRADIAVPRDDLVALLRALTREFSQVRRALERTNSFLDRLHGAGSIPRTAVRGLSPTGPVGKSMGFPDDWRWLVPYDAYREVLAGEVPVTQAAGDAFGRYWVRAEEVAQSLRCLGRVAELGSASASSPGPRELVTAVGFGLVEGPRGSLVYRVTMTAPDHVDGVSVATASARNWGAVGPALDAGNILQDFPIIDASFGLLVSAWDL